MSAYDSSDSDEERKPTNRSMRKIVMKVHFASSSSDDDIAKPSTSRGIRHRKNELNSSNSESEIECTTIMKRTKRTKSYISDDSDSSSDSSWSPNGTETNNKKGIARNAELLPTSDTDSNDSTVEKCPICLLSFRKQEIGVPNVCDHQFCVRCIEEWSKTVQTCPIDRQDFNKILVHPNVDIKKVCREIIVEKSSAVNTNLLDDFTYCEICNECDREDSMLLCDNCDKGFHMSCLNPPLIEVPTGSWYCDNCFSSAEESNVEEDLTQLIEEMEEMGVPETRFRIRQITTPRIPRTRQSERIRSFIRSQATRHSRTTTDNTVVDISLPGPSTSCVISHNVVRKPAKKRAKRRTKRRKRRSTKRRTFVVEYDINDYDNKFAIKTRKVIKRRRKRTRKVSRKKKCAKQNINNSSEKDSFKIFREIGKSRLKPTGFTLLGRPNDLDYFPSEEDDSNIDGFNEHLSGGVGVLVQSGIRHFRNNLLKQKATSLSGPVSTDPDLLSNIMDAMDRLRTINNRRVLDTAKQYDNFQSSEAGVLNSENRNNRPGDMKKHILTAPLYSKDGNNSTQEFTNCTNRQSESNQKSTESPSSYNNGQDVGNGNSGSRMGDNLESTNSIPEDFSNREIISDPSINNSLHPIGHDAKEKIRRKSNDKTTETSKSGEHSTMGVTDSNQTGTGNVNNLNASGINENTVSQGDSSLAETSSSSVVIGRTNNLTQITSADEDDCPNLSVYSIEVMRLAKNGLEKKESIVTESNVDDNQYEERDEDLVQMGDDDDDDDDDIMSEEQNTSLKDNQEINEDNIISKKGNRNKKNVLDLYDDSDWEEWNVEKPDESQGRDQTLNEIENNPIEPELQKLEDDQSNKFTDTISDIGDEENDEKSYTPCLDEIPSSRINNSKEGYDIKNDAHIDGVELISDNDDDEAILNAGSVNNGKKKRKMNDTKHTDKEYSTQQSKQEPIDSGFKKFSKNTKDRNYREKERIRNSRSRSRSSRGRHKSSHNRRRSNASRRRDDLERYNVRNLLNKRDEFGRNTSRPRSRSQSRSSTKRRRHHSYSRERDRRSKSRSFSSHRNSRRSRTHSPRNGKRKWQSKSPRNVSTDRRHSITSSRRRISTSRNKSNSKENSISNQRAKRVRNNYSRSISPHHREKDLSSCSRSRSREKHSHEKLRKSKNKRNKKDSRKPSKSEDNNSVTRHTISPNRSGGRLKKRELSKSISPSRQLSSWSRSLSSDRIMVNRDDIVSENCPENLTVILKNKESRIKSKKKEKKKHNEKRKDYSQKKEKKKSRTEKSKEDSSGALSKEVFASGDNILVSVSFNKNKEQSSNPKPQQTTIVTVPPTKELLISKQPARKQNENRKSRKENRDLASPSRSNDRPPKHKKINAKPIAIIDLDRSPFKELTPSPKAVIILSDSEQEENPANEINSRNVQRQAINVLSMGGDSLISSDNDPKTFQVESPIITCETFESCPNTHGPKTPPEPLVKFSLPLKSKSKMRAVNNPLHDTNDIEEDEVTGIVNENDNICGIDSHVISTKVGPNTPPESGPCSPDVYDPFDPTKSPSSNSSGPQLGESTQSDRSQLESHTPELNPYFKEDQRIIQNLSTSHDRMIPGIESAYKHGNTTDVSLESSGLSQDGQIFIQSPSPIQKKDTGNVCNTKQSITIISDVIIPGKSTDITYRNTGRPLMNMHHLPSISTVSPVKPTISSHMHKNASIKKPLTTTSKLPMPKVGNSNILSMKTQNFSRQNGEDDMELESPYSPGSSDYEDLFEPPVDAKQYSSSSTNVINKSSTNRNIKSSQTSTDPVKPDLFDDLFGSISPPQVVQRGTTSRIGKSGKHSKKTLIKVHKPTNAAVATTSGFKLNEDQLRILDDCPSSAVELQVKDKFLRKLNRQERVVEEVKLVLKPHYNKKHISKEDYKEILRRAVPKICHNRKGEINPQKIQALIEAYVKKFRHKRKEQPSNVTLNI